jgi:hypothetical protein
LLSDFLVTVNTRSTLTVPDGGEITPYVLTTTVLLELKIAMVYPSGTVGIVKLVAFTAGAITLVIPAATSSTVGTCAGTFTMIVPVFALMSLDILVTVNTRLTLVSTNGGAITPFVPTTAVLLELAIAMLNPAGNVGIVKFVASVAGAVTLVIADATSSAVGSAIVW